MNISAMPRPALVMTPGQERLQNASAMLLDRNLFFMQGLFDRVAKEFDGSNNCVDDLLRKNPNPTMHEIIAAIDPRVRVAFLSRYIQEFRKILII